LRTILITLFSAVASAASGLAAYRGFEHLPGTVRIIGFGVAALLIGLLQGKLFGAAAYKAAGVGAFLGVCVLWTPVVLVTYGFALAGIHYLFAYAGIVAVGVQWGAKRPVRAMPEQ
jgi:hypothetical protein